MPVEFSVSPSQLCLATKQLIANRGKYIETDSADIRVFQTVAIFHCVGTESELPVDGKETGSLRMPLRVLDRISEVVSKSKSGAVTLICEPGLVKIDTLLIKHSEIELRKGPTERLSLPIDMSLLDTLALTKILSSRAIDEEGMRARANEAHKLRRSAIAGALSALQSLGIEEWQVNHLVDTHITEAAKRLETNPDLSCFQ
ncbi:MAG TPA: hypothetical protein VFA90_05570 [Terriglobales bacterium]|nr:hypothetical protein [Terriglobales bacterium]